MKSRIVIEVLLVAVGIIALSSGGITHTTQERVLDIFGVGIVLLVVGLRRR